MENPLQLPDTRLHVPAWPSGCPRPPLPNDGLYIVSANQIRCESFHAGAGRGAYAYFSHLAPTFLRLGAVWVQGIPSRLTGGE